MDTPAETLTDGVVSLRRWRVTQRDEQLALITGSLEHIGAWMIWATNGYSAEDSAEYLERTERQWDEGETFDYAIYSEGELAGGCGLMRRDGGREIGYWLGRAFTGRGLMTRAVTLLVAEAFARGAGYVEIKHDELNVRSGAVPARLGFTKVGQEPAEKPLAPACGGTNHVWRKDS
jgi:RimJ/RimL family protein N-acetyltransferase